MGCASQHKKGVVERVGEEVRREYIVTGKDDPAVPSWSELSEPITAEAATTSWTDRSASQSLARIYRIVVS